MRTANLANSVCAGRITQVPKIKQHKVIQLKILLRQT